MNRLADQLAKHEGVKRFAYKCPAGKWTIGVGRNIDEDGGLGLSDGEIYTLLNNDIQRTDEELTNAFRFYEDLDRVRKDAMINICFNIGLPRLRGFSGVFRLSMGLSGGSEGVRHSTHDSTRRIS